MKRTTKLLILLLALAMVFSLIPAVARAEEASVDTETVTVEIPFRVNPLYEGIITADDLKIPEFPERDPNEVEPNAGYYNTIEQAGAMIRSYMKARYETFTINVYADTSDGQLVGDQMFEVAFAHTGVATEGDYLRWQYGGWEAEATRSYNETYKRYEYTYNFVVPYYTTAEQEWEMSNAVSNLISSLGLWNKTDHDKISALYDWICQNVTYDYENLEDTTYTRKHTAYAALIDKTAVCQGYALLFYRVMLEVGVDNRLIAGLAASGEAHGWNIVKLNNLYYNLDTTWDAGQDEYIWFLNNTWDFVGHYRFLEYESWDFHDKYPMAEKTYDPSITATKDPYIYLSTCGENAYWLLSRDGTLTIFGEGSTDSYLTKDHALEDRAPWRYWDERITTVVVDEGITGLGSYNFDNMENLSSVSFPSTLTNIGSYTFSYCELLTEIALPDGLTKIQGHAFAYCSGLTEVEIPSSVTTVSGFDHCENLSKVVLHEGTVVIGSDAFRSCISLKDISLPSTLRRIEGYSFYDTAITELNLPQGITTIESDAFRECNNLTEITLPLSLTSFRDGFRICRNLAVVNFPEGMTTISNGAFSGCESLTTVNFPNTLTNIESKAFSDCGFTELDLPDSLTSIESDAFYNCDSLTEVTIPRGITIMDGFSHCSNLVTVNMPDTITEIARSAFAACSSLSSIYIPEGVTKIGHRAFEYCSSLVNIDLPDSLETIDTYAFYSCKALSEIIIPNKVTSVDGFYGCENLKMVVLHENVTKIQSEAFALCPSLTDIALPEGLKSIGNQAFRLCKSLKEITIPSTVTYLDIGCFSSCEQLESIVFLGNAPYFEYYVFDNTVTTAYYPANNPTWTEDKLQSYGGTITWVPYGEVSEPTAKFTTISTSLGGNIAMNFYLELSEDLVADPNAYIQFTYAGKTLNVPLSEGVLSGGVYRFACPITSKNMTDEITAQVYNGNGPVGESKTMDVATYCNWVIANYTDAKTVNLMKAMLNYGASAQLLFNYRTDDLANAALADSDKVLGKVDASAYVHSRTGEEEGIKPDNYTLLLDSETTVRVYFKLTGDKAIDEYTFTVDGVEVEPVYKDGLYYIQKTDIGAHRLDELHVFTCGNITIRYGGLSYVNQVMTYYTEGTTFDMASALFAYSKAAEEYIG